jgi:hypothetical protein
MQLAGLARSGDNGTAHAGQSTSRLAQSHSRRSAAGGGPTVAGLDARIDSPSVKTGSNSPHHLLVKLARDFHTKEAGKGREINGVNAV